MESDKERHQKNLEHRPFIFWDDVQWEEDDDPNHDYLVNSEGD